MRRRHEYERLDGLWTGAVGSVAGLVAMALFSKATAKLGNGGGNGHAEERDAGGENGASHQLDDISVDGIKAREGEPATETVARIGYHAATDHDPDEAMRHKLGQAVHYGYGILVGGAYGALRPKSDGLDLLGGLGYGTALWAIGDELMVPLLGLAKGPTAHPWQTHAKALAAHLAYGAATAAATQGLRRVT